jgi:hypothetical protein
VVELTGLTGAYATRLWAALGADVVVVEPPEGHVLRRLPPFAPGDHGDDGSLWWAYFAQGKRSAAVDSASPAYRALVASADVVITDVDPSAGCPQPAHARQVVVAVSPFGLTGPRRGWKGSELIGWFAYAPLSIGLNLLLQSYPVRVPARIEDQPFTVAKPDLPDGGFHAGIDPSSVGGMPAAETRAPESDSVRVNLRLVLHVGDSITDIINLLQRDQPPFCSLALPKAAIVERQRDKPCLHEDPCIIRQDPGA